jgi:hypothetical protein
LYPLDAVVGGLLAFGGNGVREALRRFRDVVASSPRELSCQAGISVDESLAPALVVAPCYTGSAADPEELRSLRSGPGPVDDGARAHSFLEQQGVFDSAYGENRDYWKGRFVRELPDELIDELLPCIASTTCRRTSRSSACVPRSAMRRSHACRLSRDATTRPTSCAETRTSRRGRSSGVEERVWDERQLSHTQCCWLGGEESVEERAVAGECDTEVFGGDVVAPVPLFFEALSFVREACCESLHQVGYKGVGLLDGVARLIDEAGLDLPPASGEMLALIVGEKRPQPGSRSCSFASVSGKSCVSDLVVGLVPRERLV